ncbi:MAG: TylF/MycF/NovP-related O-methyltransferase, partial [Candidatus Nanopelagicales bacterium]
IVDQVTDPLIRQRIKLVWFGWGYLPVLAMSEVPFEFRLRLFRAMLRIDWNVLHGHSPSEIAHVFRGVAERRAEPGEAVVEAGCWRGGSSAKFSLLCQFLGYELHIYDSFEGVGDLTEEDRAKEWDYEGQYSAPESTLRENLERFGAPSVCHIHKGWFSETLAAGQCPERVRVAYIDCDIAKGTHDALRGISSHLTSDAVVFTQDFHIEPIRRLVFNERIWPELGLAPPRLESLGRRLASLRFGASGV